MKTKTKTLFRDVIIFSFGSLGSKVILFLIVPFYTHYLSPEEYGIADLVFTISQIVIPVVSFVIYEAVVRFGLQTNIKSKEVLKSGFIICIIGSAITLLSSFCFDYYKPISKFRWYLSIYVIFSMFSLLFKNYLKVKDRNFIYSITSIAQTLTLAFSNIILLAVYNYGIKGYLISNIFGEVVSIMICFISGEIIHDLVTSRINYFLLINMAKYSFPLIFNNISWWIIHSSNKFIVEAILTSSALGLYTVATKIPSLINVFIAIFAQAWNISSIKEYDSSKDRTFFAQVFKFYSLVVFLFCIILNLIIKDFMHFYVSSEYFVSWKFIPLLIVSAGFLSIASYFGQIYSALKKTMNNMISTLIAAIINLVLGILLVNHCGLLGAVISTLCAYIFLGFFRMFDIQRLFKIDISFVKLISNCLIILIQGALVSSNYHCYFVSVISLILFILINYKELIVVFLQSKSLLRIRK